MATKTKSDSLPTKDSVVKKDPLPVLEVSPKKVVLVKQQSSSSETTPVEENQPNKGDEMEVDGASDDVISPNNQS